MIIAILLFSLYSYAQYISEPAGATQLKKDVSANNKEKAIRKLINQSISV
jgi:hypothetical protein